MLYVSHVFTDLHWVVVHFCFQYKFDEVMEGKKPLNGSEGDRVVFAAQAISKLTVLQYLVKKAQMYASLTHRLALMHSVYFRTLSCVCNMYSTGFWRPVMWLSTDRWED